jgi:hypothetical protein
MLPWAGQNPRLIFGVDLFGIFAGTIGSLPARAVIAVTEREREMIEDDIFQKRPFPVKDTMSILSFCQFIHSLTAGLTPSPCISPSEHIDFYRRTIARLIAAGEFPPVALRQFDETFLGSSPEEITGSHGHSLAAWIRQLPRRRILRRKMQGFLIWKSKDEYFPGQIHQWKGGAPRLPRSKTEAFAGAN